MYAKKIIHIDMDCFYASVEMRENPSLMGKPVAVGGSPTQRGVLATCNYEARQFGLHSAMASSQAVKRCPNLVLLPPNMPLYREVSAQIHQIFHRYTDLIEPLSLDEAYLDVSHCQQCQGSATWIAKAIRETIWQELHLTASAGIAPLKFLAKIASDQNKPNGQFVIRPEQVADFIYDLPLKKIPGVGKVTNERLNQLGLVRCADVQNSDKAMLFKQFGKLGQRIWDFSHGIDERPVERDRPRKSIAVENTLLVDIDRLSQAEAVVDTLFDKLVARITRQCGDPSFLHLRKLGIKLKFADFSQTTLEKTVIGFSKAQFLPLLHEIWQRRVGRKVRLIGLSVHLPEESSSVQLDLWL